MQKCPPETVQWIQKVRISWKNGLSFKLKHRNAQKHKLGIFFWGGGAAKRSRERERLCLLSEPEMRSEGGLLIMNLFERATRKNANKWATKFVKLDLFLVWKGKHFFFTSLQASQVIKLKHFWEARVYKIFFNPRHLYWNVRIPSILETTAETPSTCYARW